MKNVSIAGIGNDNIKRDRKLLLKKQELVKIQKSLVKGLTIVPYKMYQKKNILKVEIVLARGKNLHDKRESIKERDIKKEVNRILK